MYCRNLILCFFVWMMAAAVTSISLAEDGDSVYHVKGETRYHLKECPRLWGDMEWYGKMSKSEAEAKGLTPLCPYCPGSTMKRPKVPHVESWVNPPPVHWTKSKEWKPERKEYIAPDSAPLVSMSPGGKLIYKPYSDKGDRILDFSQCGYMRSEIPIPDVPVVETLTPPAGRAKPVGKMAYPVGPDSRGLIQGAIDKVAKRDPDAQGLRGAVLLKKGTWYVYGGLRVLPGVVLRGEGDGEDGTVLIFHKHDRAGISLGGGGGGGKFYTTVNGMLSKEKLENGKDGAFLILENGHKFQVNPSRNPKKYNPLDYVGSKVTVYFRATKQQHGEKTIAVIRDIRVAKIEKLKEGQDGPPMLADLFLPGMELPPLPESRIADEYLPSGSIQLTLEDARGFKVGDYIEVIKTTNEKWRRDLGMGERLRHIRGGKHGYKRPWPLRTFGHPRQILAIKGNTITLDVVLPQSIAAEYGGGKVTKVSPRSKHHCGAEHLRIVSNYDKKQKSQSKQASYVNLKSGIEMSCTHGWARNCTVLHVWFSAATLSGQFNTVREVKYLKPVGPKRGGKYYPFSISGDRTFGNLVYKCYAEGGRHSFAVGAKTQGPNAYVKCTAIRDGQSEPHHRWGSGILYDSITLKDGGALAAINRGDSGSGHGWAGANVVFWNCNAENILVFDPETEGENNFAIGYTGKMKKEYDNGGLWYANTRAGYWGTPREGKYYGYAAQGNGHIESPDKPVKPGSLFEQQLVERIGKEKAAAVLK